MLKMGLTWFKTFTRKDMYLDEYIPIEYTGFNRIHKNLYLCFLRSYNKYHGCNCKNQKGSLPIQMPKRKLFQNMMEMRLSNFVIVRKVKNPKFSQYLSELERAFIGLDRIILMD